MSAARIEPSSFRDPNSRVVESDGAVLRLLSEQGLRDWQALEASKLFHSAVAAGKLVGTEVEPKHGTLPDALVDGAAAVLEHESSRSSRIRTSGRSRCSATPRCSSSSCFAARSTRT